MTLLIAFCDCLDSIADAANKSIPGSTGQCPEDVDGNFWTSGGGHFRVARITEITANYSAGLQLENELTPGDRVWACNREDSGNYGVTTMAADGSVSSCCGGNDYCGYPSYNNRYTVCVDMNAPVGSGNCGSRCGL
jgi:hypothetical protein